MSLKQIATDILKIAGVVVGILPAAEQIMPQAAPVVQRAEAGLTKFFAIVQDVEVAGQALNIPGPDKLKMATPIVAQELFKVLDELGLKVANQPAFVAAATGYASVTADLLNAIEKQ